MASNGFWGCAVKRSMIVLLSTVTCAVVLALGMTGLALAEDELPPPAETWQVRTIPTPVREHSLPSSPRKTGDWPGPACKRSTPRCSSTTSPPVPTHHPNRPPGDYYNPSADGAWVVFQGRTRGRVRRHLPIRHRERPGDADVTNNAEVGDWNDWNPRVDGNRIVWQKDATNATPGIYLYSIAYPPTRSLLIPA